MSGAPTVAIEAVLEALDPHATHPETLPLFDAFFYLKDALGEGDDDAARAQVVILRRLLARSQHPIRAQLKAALDGLAGTPVGVAEAPPDTPEAVLSELGVPVFDRDVPEAMRRFVRQERELRRALQDRARWLETRYVSAARTANVLSVVSTVLAGLVVVALLVAMGVVEVAWMDPNSLEETPDVTISGSAPPPVRPPR